MINEEYTISLGAYREENAPRGTAAFPCAAYQGDVQKFVAGQIIPHWHHEIEWFFLLDGAARVSFIDQEYELHPGTGYLANSNVLHSVGCMTDQPCHYHSIVFDPSIIAGAPGSVFEKSYVRPFLDLGQSMWLFDASDNSTPDIKSLFSDAYRAFEAEPRGYEFLVRDALSRLIVQLIDASTFATKQTVIQDLRVKQMISWLDFHYREHITIEQLAETARISVRECQRIFSTVLHDTPMKYLLRRRISSAAELLASTNGSILDVATSCGFDSASYFAKQFKTLTGMTPREYRSKYSA